MRAYVVVTDWDSDHIVGFAATRGAELLHFGTAKDTWGEPAGTKVLREARLELDRPTQPHLLRS